jgi:hypothetical protein
VLRTLPSIPLQARINQCTTYSIYSPTLSTYPLTLVQARTPPCTTSYIPSYPHTGTYTSMYHVLTSGVKAEGYGFLFSGYGIQRTYGMHNNHAHHTRRTHYTHHTHYTHYTHRFRCYDAARLAAKRRHILDIRAGGMHPFTAHPFTAHPFTAHPFTAHPLDIRADTPSYTLPTALIPTTPSYPQVARTFDEPTDQGRTHKITD